MHSLLWLIALVALGLVVGPMLGIVLGFAIRGEDRLGWIAILAVIMALAVLAGWIVWRADQRRAAALRA